MPETQPLSEFILRLWAFDCTNTLMTSEIKQKFAAKTLTGNDLRQRAKQFRNLADELSAQADVLEANHTPS
jgi:hypothetical protein